MKLSTKRNSGLSKNATRQDILDLEKAISEQEGAFFGDTVNCPLKHSFADGIYVREIFIPKGTILTGKIHRHKHPNFLLKGTVDIVTEFETKRLKAPLSIISEAGTKRALYAVTDLIWVTCHANETNTQNIEELEDYIIAKSYEEYDKFIIKKKGIKSRIFGFISNTLKLLQ